MCFGSVKFRPLQNLGNVNEPDPSQVLNLTSFCQVTQLARNKIKILTVCIIFNKIMLKIQKRNCQKFYQTFNEQVFSAIFFCS
jgi:hypothetical protein